MSGKIFARATALALTALLVACGGDSGSSPLAGNADTSTSTDPNTPTTADVSSIQILTDTPTIGSAGRDSAKITALVRDKNGVLTPDVPVTFDASNNGSLVVTSSTTSDAGQATAELSSQGDARNRIISVTATAGTTSNSVNVNVSGTKISLTGPSAVSNGSTGNFEVRLLDSAGQGIADTPVQINSLNNSISSANTSTDASGKVQFSLMANSGGPDQISVSAFEGAAQVAAQMDVNISADSFAFADLNSGDIEIDSSRSLSTKWTQNGTPVAGETVRFSTTRGILSSNSVTTNGQGIATVNITSSDVGIAEITASATSSEGSQIQASQTVEFVSSNPESINVRASKTQLSTDDEANIIATVKDNKGNLVKNATVSFTLIDQTGGTLSPGSVRTDSQGRAITTYSSTSSISDKDGVQVTASITRKDGSTADKSITLTVAGRALTLILGTGNQISAPNQTLYDMPWSVLVTDANGNASAGQSVQLSVLPVEFDKGSYAWDGDSWTTNPTQTCQTNYGDPVNGTEIAKPAAAPTSVTTDQIGSVEFNIRYPKGECNWVTVKLTATSNVEGFTSSNSRTFTLPCLSADLNDEGVSPPGGSDSPYNQTSCN
jgi:hypothetical protein